MRRSLPLLLALSCWVSACAEGTTSSVTVQIATDPAQDPFRDATDLALVLEHQGVVTQELLFPIEATGGSMPGIPEGVGYVLSVEARRNGAVLARGRSFPFSLGFDAPLPRADVFVGILGLFATTSDDAPPASAVLAVTRTSRGALLVTADGSLLEYVAHGGDGGGGRDAHFVPIAVIADASSFQWAPMERGRLLAVGGPRNEALLYDASETPIASASGTGGLVLSRVGAALTTVEGGTAALLLGGSTDGGASESDSVVRVEVLEDGAVTDLTIAARPPLPSPVMDATALDIEVRGDATCPCDRVLVFGGTLGGLALDAASLIDPTGVAASVQVPLGIVRPGAALASLGTGLVAVVGGEDGVGVATDTSEILAVSTSQIDVLAPSPPALFSARTGAAATTLAEGLVLVYGGIGADGSPLASAELVEFPGNVAPTGSLPSPMASPQGVRLDDDSLLAIAEGAHGVYVVPRNL